MACACGEGEGGSEVDLADGGQVVIDGGMDAGLDDAGFDDAGLPDAGADDLGIDAGRPDLGSGDGGVEMGVDRDLGPADLGVDAGRDGGIDMDTDAGPGCMVGGTYDVTPDPANPPLCAIVMPTSCTAVQTSATSVDLTCAPLTATCTLDAACVCDGSATVMDIMGTVSVDFPGLTVQAVAAGTTCDYDLTPVP